MKKSDLKTGNIVELRNGKLFLVHKSTNGLFNEDSWTCLTEFSFGISSAYDENLKYSGCCSGCKTSYDVVKVYKDHTCTKVLWERKEIVVPKITENEKKIIGLLPAMYDEWYIARDKCGDLYIYRDKPTKGFMGYMGVNPYGVKPFTLYNQYFDSIKFEDEHVFRLTELYRGKALGGSNE